MNSHFSLLKRTSQIGRKVFMAAAFLQIICGIIFVGDILVDIQQGSQHSWLEVAGVVALIIGAGLNLIAASRIIERNKKVESELSVASGAFTQVMETRFNEWGLTVSERDVALLTIKGVSMSDIAQIRSTKSGTIKAQSAAIYKKVGVNNRAELVSVVVEELIDGLGPFPL